jgi:two-component system, chemotaxis family, sensor kinase CheA
VVTYRLSIQPHPTILNNGTNPILLVGELAELGDCTVTPIMGTIPSLDAIDPQSCYVGWMVVLSTTKDENAIRDVFIFVEGDCDLTIERITDRDLIGDETPKKIGQILIERGITSPEKISEALSEQRKIGEVLVEKNVVTADQVKSALEEQDHLRKLHEKQDQSTSIRVGSDKLDALVDLVGEMVTLQARLTQTTNAFKDGQLSSITEQFERLVSQLRDNTMTMRMLPIGTTFSKFRRLVRDLSADLHKEAEIVTEGAETELDKTVIEKLNDPLVHLIRNSLDHGIESPEERRAAGKDPKGTIKLSAAHAGANVLVTVSDDGAGLNREAIYRKAVEKGLVGANVEIADAELFQLIFAAGFSTAKTVTSVSGRGVGMDVVRREIESLGGSVGIETVHGKGTKFTLRIPLTLAIIEGLLVKIGDGFFVVPLQSVDGCIEIKSSEASGAGKGRAITSYRGDLLPYIGLREFFNFETTPPEIMQIVIVNALDSRIGLVVDSVIGEYQTVIKPLGRMFHDVEGLSGATILGDGTVALIMDVNRLAVMKNREEIHTRSITTSGRG